MKEMNICQLELLLSCIGKDIKNFKIYAELGKKEKTKVLLGSVDLDKDLFIVNKEFIDVKEIDKGSRLLKESKSDLVNALIRCSLLKVNLDKYRIKISQWDDVILGLDTNLFYNCALTSCLFNEFMKIPSGDFIDSPDWTTLVLSKVAMGEIENKANHSDNPEHRRQALRAIQEIMLINKAKDLEGVSMFLAGTIPPEFDFTKGQANTTRDSTIREQFRVFLKNLDFHKGAYFVTGDFNNAVLAEAEGLIAMYIRKPTIEQEEYELSGDDKINISELLYELAVSFDPLIVETDKIKFKVYSMWKDKTLEDWEQWKVGFEWVKVNPKLRGNINKWMDSKLPNRILAGWEKLKERQVMWSV